MATANSETSNSKSVADVAATPATVPSDSAVPSDLTVPTAGLIGQTGYSALLIAFAVFPAALGVGITSYSAAPTVGTLPESELHAAPIPNQLDAGSAGVDAARFDLVRGDNLLREAKYEAALHFYRSLESADSLPPPGKIVVRIAMCQEGLGRFDEALAGYRTVASGTDQALAAAAVLGQARVWMRLHDGQHAEPLLRSLLLVSGNRSLIPAPMAEEVAFLFPLALSEQLLHQIPPSPVAGTVPTQEVLDWSFEQPLVWIDYRPPHPELDSADDPHSSDPTLDLEIHRLPRDTATPATKAVMPPTSAGIGAPIRVIAHQRPLADVLQRLADEFQLTLVWSDELRRRATERSLDVSFSEFPATLLLAALCRDLNAIWILDEAARTLTVAGTSDERADPHMQADGHGQGDNAELADMTTNALADLVLAIPDGRLVGQGTFARAQLAAARGRPAEAARLYSTLIGRSSTPSAIRAAYNAALAFLGDGDRKRACHALETVVYGAPGHELHARALILYGRMLSELGDYREAAFQLKRAAESRDDAETRARATVFLAIAQLLDDRPRDAAESLFRHRHLFHDPPVRNAAALLTALARHRALTGPARDREAVFLYRSIVAVQPDLEWLGSTGQLLLGEAMQAVGGDDQMAELYSRALERGVPEALACEMKLALADHWHRCQRVDDARKLWTELFTSKSSPRWPVAGFHLAEQALADNDPAACLNLCKGLPRDGHVAKSELQKLTGRAYEAAGHPALAARCFAGEWPLP